MSSSSTSASLPIIWVGQYICKVYNIPINIMKSYT